MGLVQENFACKNKFVSKSTNIKHFLICKEYVTSLQDFFTVTFTQRK